MTIVSDIEGTREVGADELARLHAEAEERWTAFWSGLTWRPIAAYDRTAGRPELLRAGEQWALGYWGPDTTVPYDDEPPADPTPTWRNAQESMDGVPLDFAPIEFAEIDDHWRAALIED